MSRPCREIRRLPKALWPLYNSVGDRESKPFLIDSLKCTLTRINLPAFTSIDKHVAAENRFILTEEGSEHELIGVDKHMELFEVSYAMGNQYIMYESDGIQCIPLYDLFE